MSPERLPGQVRSGQVRRGEGRQLHMSPSRYQTYEAPSLVVPRDDRRAGKAEEVRAEWNIKGKKSSRE